MLEFLLPSVSKKEGQFDFCLFILLLNPLDSIIADLLHLSHKHIQCLGLPGGSDGIESGCNAEDRGSVPGLGRHLGEGNGYPSQYSCLENSIDRGVQGAIVYGVAKNQTQLSD